MRFYAPSIVSTMIFGFIPLTQVEAMMAQDALTYSGLTVWLALLPPTLPPSSPDTSRGRADLCFGHCHLLFGAQVRRR